MSWTGEAGGIAVRIKKHNVIIDAANHGNYF